MARAPVNRLTVKQVANAPDGAFIPDGAGLYLNTKGSARSWLLRFTLHGRRREMGLGAAADVSLAEARQKAAQAREMVRRGIDPIASRSHTTARQNTLEAALESYIELRQSKWTRADTAGRWRRMFHIHLPRLSAMNVAGITVDLVLAELRPVWATLPTAGHVAQHRLARVLAYAIARGWRTGPNPAEWRDNLEFLLPPPPTTKAHHPAVSLGDGPAVFQSLWEARRVSIGGAALCMAILTASRIAEASQLRWVDIVRFGGKPDHLLFPAAIMKARRAHRVPITPAIAELLAEQAKLIIGPGTYIFPGRNPAKPVGVTSLRRAMKAVDKNATVHGWRAVWAQWCAANNVEREHSEDALAHLIGSAVERAYRRADYLEQRREIMARYQDWLFGQDNIPAGNARSTSG